MPGIKVINDLQLSQLTDTKKSPHESSVPDKYQCIWRVPKANRSQSQELRRPYDVTFWNNCVAVAEGFWPYSKIPVFTNAGKKQDNLADGEVLPFGMTLTPEGHLAVTDHHDRTVKIIIPNTSTVLSWKPKLFNWPNGITFDMAGYFAIADWAAGTVCIHDTEGQNIHSFATCDGTCVRSCPEYIVSDSHGRLLMTDVYDHTVKVFDNTGQLLFKFGQGKDKGAISDPRGIALDSKDNILVADWMSDTVRMYSSDGVHIEDILHPHQVTHPWGVALNTDGSLAVTEQKLNATPSLKMFKPAE